MLLRKLIPLGIPLAWLNLIKEKKRFFAAVAGITFAVTMMMFQMGLNTALFQQVVGPHAKMKADIFIVSSHYEYLGVSKGFPLRRLVQAGGLSTVERTIPMYVGALPMVNTDNQSSREVFALSWDPAYPAFNDEEIESQRWKLKREGVALYDRLSRPELGPFVQQVEETGEAVTEVANRRMTFEGLFSCAPTFVADGILLTNKSTFLPLWPGEGSSVVSLGLVQLKEGSDAQAAVAALQEMLPNDVRIYTRDGFLQYELNYWRERTPIGFVITASMAVALIVGMVIVYQILYTDVNDHLEEYATLKSIGFRDSYFNSVILQESFILSVFGFVPGTILTAVMFAFTRQAAHLATYLDLTNCLIIFGLTLGMCMAAGGLATRKLRAANPAEIF
ncbi:MAG: ABC transporter permease DevC [Verrucomicrobiota bacterium]